MSSPPPQEEPADWSAEELDRAEAEQLAQDAGELREAILILRAKMDCLTVCDWVQQ